MPIGAQEMRESFYLKISVIFVKGLKKIQWYFRFQIKLRTKSYFSFQKYINFGVSLINKRFQWIEYSIGIGSLYCLDKKNRSI